MSLNNSPCPRGTVFYSGTAPATVRQGIVLEGLPVEYEDISYVDQATKVSARKVEGVLVKNVSGIALRPGRLVSWASGYEGRRVDGYADETGGKVAGIVDDWLPAAGAADDQVFNLIIKGPVRVSSAVTGAAAVVANGDHLTAGTAADSTGTTAGRAVSIDADTTTLTHSYARRIIGIALEANTTSQTATLFNAAVDIQLAD